MNPEASGGLDKVARLLVGGRDERGRCGAAEVDEDALGARESWQTSLPSDLKGFSQHGALGVWVDEDMLGVISKGKRSGGLGTIRQGKGLKEGRRAKGP
jgi:hypothetical protein